MEATFSVAVRETIKSAVTMETTHSSAMPVPTASAAETVKTSYMETTGRTFSTVGTARIPCMAAAMTPFWVVAVRMLVREVAGSIRATWKLLPHVSSNRLRTSGRLLVGLLLVASVSSSCSGEFEADPRIRLTLTNESESDTVYFVVTTSSVSEEQALSGSFNSVTAGRSQLVFLGGERTGADPAGGCLRPGEEMWIFESPSGTNAPVRDPQTQQEIRLDLIEWVPDASVWMKLDQTTCFDGGEHQLRWPE